MDTIDIVIPLGDGSRYGDAELLYCLRGVEKHLTGVGSVIIVGKSPIWLQNCIEIEATDKVGGQYRAQNIYNKICLGAAAVSGPAFLYMNDDHFLLQDYCAYLFPYYHRGKIKLENHLQNLPQLRQYNNTVKALPGLSNLFDFGVHCPMFMQSFLFDWLDTEIPNEWPDYGYEIKSLYANHRSQRQWWELCQDLKFQQPLAYGIIKQQLAGRPWFSVGDRCLNGGGMFKVLEELYPNKSKYEI